MSDESKATPRTASEPQVRSSELLAELTACAADAHEQWARDPNRRFGGWGRLPMCDYEAIVQGVLKRIRAKLS